MANCVVCHFVSLLCLINYPANEIIMWSHVLFSPVIVDYNRMSGRQLRTIFYLKVIRSRLPNIDFSALLIKGE